MTFVLIIRIQTTVQPYVAAFISQTSYIYTMDRPFTFKVLLTSILILVLPALVWANASSITVPHLLTNNNLTDTVRQQQQDEKKDKSKEKQDLKQQPEKPDIREVPKARKQSRPPVVKPNIKAKPVKVIRPKIKRP